MADTWLTIEQAAVALRLSVRTVNRHITSDKLQSRLSEGRREVLVSLPENAAPLPSANGDAFVRPETRMDAEPSARSSTPSQPSATQNAEQGEEVESHEDRSEPRQTQSASTDAPPLNANTLLALSDNDREKTQLAVSAYQTLARSAEAQRQTTQRWARFAWLSVAGMAVIVIMGVGWTTRELTRKEMENDQLHQLASDKTIAADKAAVTVEKIQNDRENLLQQLTDAQSQRARLEGRMSAMLEAQAQRPTTRPTLMERLATIFEGH